MISKMTSKMVEASQMFQGIASGDECPTNPFLQPIVEAVTAGGSVDRNASVWSIKDAIIDTVSDNQVTLVVGSTGCGKSTGVPVILYEHGWAARGQGRIAVVVPSALGARSLSEFVKQLMPPSERITIGYQTKAGSRWDPKVTKVLFMTDTILMEDFQKNPLLPDLDVIILDDAHLRTMKQEVIIGLTKRLLDIRRHSLKLVISSASLDLESWITYFMDRPATSQSSESASQHSVGVCNIPSRASPLTVETYTKEVPCDDYLAEALKCVLNIHTDEADGAILVFLPGKDEILSAVSWVKQWNESLRESDAQQQRTTLRPLRPLALYPGMDVDEQQKAIAPVAFESSTNWKYGRKVIFAHPIAESTLTIADVSFIVDSLYEERIVFHTSLGPSINVKCAVPTSRVSLMQRAGRVGRVRAGKVFQLGRREDLEKNIVLHHGELARYPLPELWGSDITPLVMLIKSMGFSKLSSIDFLTPPPVRCCLMALETLECFGVLNKEGALTELGRYVRMVLQWNHVILVLFIL
eukprot:GHVH01013879.1.p1 GENE.GHVH01013879.1~~GHVH01013879.1.p1  ORF type:complete len:525 (+),score=87.98 GHVH01013879.1:25-1599(+)